MVTRALDVHSIGRYRRVDRRHADESYAGPLGGAVGKLEVVVEQGVEGRGLGAVARVGADSAGDVWLTLTESAVAPAPGPATPSWRISSRSGGSRESWPPWRWRAPPSQEWARPPPRRLRSALSSQKVPPGKWDHALQHDRGECAFSVTSPGHPGQEVWPQSAGSLPACRRGRDGGLAERDQPPTGGRSPASATAGAKIR